MPLSLSKLPQLTAFKSLPLLNEIFSETENHVPPYSQFHSKRHNLVIQCHWQVCVQIQLLLKFRKSTELKSCLHHQCVYLIFKCIISKMFSFIFLFIKFIYVVIFLINPNMMAFITESCFYWIANIIKLFLISKLLLVNIL